jgi:hypothetical protein
VAERGPSATRTMAPTDTSGSTRLWAKSRQARKYEVGYSERGSTNPRYGRTISTSNRQDGGVRREARQGEEGRSAGWLCKGLRDLPPLPRSPYWTSRSDIVSDHNGRCLRRARDDDLPLPVGRQCATAYQKRQIAPYRSSVSPPKAAPICCAAVDGEKVPIPALSTCSNVCRQKLFFRSEDGPPVRC